MATRWGPWSKWIDQIDGQIRWRWNRSGLMTDQHTQFRLYRKRRARRGRK